MAIQIFCLSIGTDVGDVTSKELLRTCEGLKLQ